MIEDKHIGSSLEAFLQEEGRLEEARQVAAKRVLSWQLREAMKSLHLNKAEMAKRMQTSRSQLDRLLDPENDKVQLDTLSRAAARIHHRIAPGAQKATRKSCPQCSHLGRAKP